MADDEGTGWGSVVLGARDGDQGARAGRAAREGSVGRQAVPTRAPRCSRWLPARWRLRRWPGRAGGQPRRHTRGASEAARAALERAQWDTAGSPSWQTWRPARVARRNIAGGS